MINNLDQYLQGIGSRILCRRKSMGLTQHELAEMSGISPQFFSCIETGRKNIRSKNVIRLSIALGVSTDYILMGRSNVYDCNVILELMKELNEDQLRYAEEIIRNFVLACHL